MLGDQAGRDHLVGERLVDGKGLAAGRLFQLVDGADRQDAVAQDCDGGCRGHVGIESDDLLCPEDRDARQRLAVELAGHVLEGSLQSQRRGGGRRLAQEGAGRGRGRRLQYLPARGESVIAEGLGKSRVADEAHRGSLGF